MHQYVAKYYNRLDGHMKELLHGASVALVLKVLAAGVSFALNVALARLLGADGAGLYFLALTLIMIAATLGRIGMDNALVRFVAANASIEAWSKVKGVYSKSLSWVLVSSSILALMLFFAAPWLAVSLFGKPDLGDPVRWMALAVVPLALFTLHAQALQGLKRIRDAISVLSVVPPIGTLLGCLLLVPFYGVVGAVWAYTIAAFIALSVGIWRWRRATPSLTNFRGHFATRDLLQSSIPLLGVAAMNLIMAWSATLFLGMWRTSADVGIFQVANRIAMLTSFALVAVNSIAAPKFASLFRQGDIPGIETTAKHSTRLMVLVASPILLICIVKPEWMMGIFGPEFTGGATILTILAVGQFVNVVTGSVGQILIMSGHENALKRAFSFSAFVAVMLGIVTIPRYGSLGAAVTTSVSVIVVNLVAAYSVKTLLGINPLWFFLPGKSVEYETRQ